MSLYTFSVAAKDLPRDDTVIVEKSVSFTSDTEHSFHLQQCDLILNFPEGIISTLVESVPVSYDVTVKGLWGGQFVFPKGAQLISAVTSVSLTTSAPLDKPVTVQLMHCASITDHFQSNYLSYVVSHSVQPPFEFDLLQGGDFPASSQYGSIQLKEFSLLAIVRLRHVIANAAAGVPLNLLSVGFTLGGVVVFAHATGLTIYYLHVHSSFVDLQPSCYYQEIEYHRNVPPHKVLLSLGVSLDLPWAVEVSTVCCLYCINACYSYVKKSFPFWGPNKEVVVFDF